jgi:hypothetical protein
MPPGQATISAVLATLLRATVDASTTVVLRTRRPARDRALAVELAYWLEQVHGSQRNVVTSATRCGEIEVRLPRDMTWPPPSALAGTPRLPSPLAAHGPSRHLSPMHSSFSSSGPV